MMGGVANIVQWDGASEMRHRMHEPRAKKDPIDWEERNIHQTING